MAPRLWAALTAGKLTARLSRSLGLGGGTALPGRVARWVAPDLLGRLARGLPHGVVVVTGTNGKTTTARLVATALQAAGLRVVHNRAGANLPAGLLSTLLLATDGGGRPRADVGVFEVDEAAFPRVGGELQPRVVVLTNLFRDQLDRYAEVDRVAQGWREVLRALGGEAVVCFNADDPQVADVARDAAQKVAFGIEDPEAGREGLEDAADVRYCYRCGVPYRYRVVFLSHVGHYACPSCGTLRPQPAVRAEAVRVAGTSGFAAELAWDGRRLGVRCALPGLYNVYNVLAAAAAAHALELPPQALQRAVEAMKPAFGRGERLRWQGVCLQILLVKNPAGFNEVLRALRAEPVQSLWIAIHDRTADGRDVSWLWDVDFESVREWDAWVTVTGLRAEDLAVRLKYAGWREDRITVQRDLPRALRHAVARTPPGATLYCLPTYTAMLELRALLARSGVVAAFWED
jgi:UDP-N-acetylmuramyl tripeptide synthase